MAVESEAEASRLSASENRQVEVLAAKTDRARTWVNPDGTHTTTTATAPVRFEDDKGDWLDIDLTVRQGADGTFTAASAARAVTLPATAAGVVSLPTPAGAVSIAHPGVASVAGVADGFTVTYPGAVGGRDLVQQLLVSGVEETVVLDSASDGSSYDTQFTLPAGATTRAVAGGVEFVTAEGKSLGRFGGGLAFDAAGADAPVSTTLISRAGRVATVRAAINPGWVADSRRHFPVHLDPVYTWRTVDGGSSDSYISSGGGASTAYWGATEIRVGYGFGAGTDVARGLVHVGMGSLVATNMTVSEAHLTVQNIQSSSCAAGPTRLWGLLGGFNSGTTWNGLTSNGTSTAYFDSAYTSQTAGAFGATGCAVQTVNLDATTLARAWAVAPGNRQNFGMQLTMPENSANGWKKYRSGEGNPAQAPLLSITYNRRPSTPTSSSTTPSTPCATGTGRPFLNTLTPTFTATIADVDSVNSRAQVEIWPAAGSAYQILGFTSGGTPSVPKSYTVPTGTPLTNGQSYKWKTRGDDGFVPSLAYTPFCEFTVDMDPPAAPTVSSAAYPANAWQSSTTAGSFTFSSTGHSDVKTWEYQFGSGTVTNFAGVLGANSTTTATITPPAGLQTMTVVAVDRAGNRSTPTTYSFSSGTTLTSPDNGVVTAKQVKLGAIAQSGTGVQYFYKTPTESSWHLVPQSAVTSGGSGVTWPVTTIAGTGSVTSPELVLDVDQIITSGSTAVDASVLLKAEFSTSGTVTSSTSDVVAVARDHNAFGAAFATAQVGPGTVSLLTGNYSVSATDASAASYGSDLTVGRTFNSMDPNASGVFGPGWLDSVGVAGIDSNHTELSDKGGTVTITDGDGRILQFTKVSGSYVGHGGAGGLTLGGVGTVTNGPESFVLKDEAGNRTFFTVDNGFAAPADLATPHVYPLRAVEQASQTVDSQTTQYGSDGQGRVDRVVAPAPPTVTCSADVDTVPSYNGGTGTSNGMGCRALDLVYTTVNGGAHVRLTAAMLRTTDGTGAEVNVALACYGYDTNGRLSTAWDPRIAGTFNATIKTLPCGSTPTSADLPTTYSYDDTGSNPSGRLIRITPAGLAAWNLHFDSSSNKLTHVSRQHSGTRGTGTEEEWVDYNVPIGSTTTTDATHPDLSSNTIEDWGQTDQPTTAVAIYAPGASRGSANGGDYRDATIHALNFDGVEVNTVGYSGTDQAGWRIDTTEYTDDGQLRRTLTAANRDRALRRSDAPASTVEMPNDTAGAARMLDTSYLYADNPHDSSIATGDMQDLVDVFGPLHETVVPDPTGVLPEGTTVAARAHTHYDYDTGGETGHPFDKGLDGNDLTTKSSWHLTAAEWTEASPGGGVFYGTNGPAGSDRRITTYSYTLGSDTSGWTFSTPLQTTVQPGGGAAAMTSTSALDPVTGMVTETRQPEDAGTAGAGTTQTVYYADGTTNNSSCLNRAWYMQICKTQPAAQPGTAGMPQLPVTSTTYDWLLRPQTITQNVTDSGGSPQSRTSSTTFENSGIGPRPTGASSNISLSGSTALPTVTTSYDSSTGRLTGLTAGGSYGTLTSGYDDFGRQVSFADADSGSSTTSYGSNGRVASSSEAFGGSTLRTTTYAYNGGNERRGLPTSSTTTGHGAGFTGTYDATGQLSTQVYPNGINATWTRDEAGAAISLTYGKSGTTWFADTQRYSIHGQIRTHDGLPSTQIYAYDGAGRLTETRDKSITSDTTDYTCSTRRYTFDANSNREILTTYGDNGGCQTTSGASVTLEFDSADRMKAVGRAASITYDAFGRTLNLPAALTTVSGTGGTAVAHSYYANDLIRQQTAGSNVRTWQLDPTLQRFRSYTDNSSGTTVTKTNHFATAGGDSPSWIDEGSNTQTRYGIGLDGNLAATDSRNSSTGVLSGLVFSLTNLHGDLVTTATAGATLYDGPVNDTDEYGNEKTPSTDRYGWLGGKQRSTEAAGGMILMGVRLYSSNLGRFLTADPIYWGAENAYAYPTDPVNNFDLSGRVTDIRPPWRLTRSAPSYRGASIFGYGGFGYNFQLNRFFWSFQLNFWEAAQVAGPITELTRMYINGRLTTYHSRHLVSDPYYVFHGSAHLFAFTGRPNRLLSLAPGMVIKMVCVLTYPNTHRGMTQITATWEFRIG